MEIIKPSKGQSRIVDVSTTTSIRPVANVKPALATTTVRPLGVSTTIVKPSGLASGIVKPAGSTIIKPPTKPSLSTGAVITKPSFSTTKPSLGIGETVPVKQPVLQTVKPVTAVIKPSPVAIKDVLAPTVKPTFPVGGTKPVLPVNGGQVSNVKPFPVTGGTKLPPVKPFPATGGTKLPIKPTNPVVDLGLGETVVKQPITNIGVVTPPASEPSAGGGTSSGGGGVSGGGGGGTGAEEAEVEEIATVIEDKKPNWLMYVLVAVGLFSGYNALTSK